MVWIFCKLVIEYPKLDREFLYFKGNQGLMVIMMVIMCRKPLNLLNLGILLLHDIQMLPKIQIELGTKIII